MQSQKMWWHTNTVNVGASQAQGQDLLKGLNYPNPCQKKKRDTYLRREYKSLSKEIRLQDNVKHSF